MRSQQWPALLRRSGLKGVLRIYRLMVSPPREGELPGAEEALLTHVAEVLWDDVAPMSQALGDRPRAPLTLADVDRFIASVTALPAADYAVVGRRALESADWLKEIAE